jgi:hypothetical protein
MHGSESHVDGGAHTAVDLANRAKYARKMHHRQMIRRGLIAGLVMAVVGLVAAISYAVFTQLSTQWILKRSGLTVDWQLDWDNWMTGGVTSARYVPLWGTYLRGSPRGREQADFTALPRLLHLESLNLAECNVGEQDLSVLSGLVELKELNLSHLDQYRDAGGSAGWSDACLRPLEGLTRLQTLSLSGNRITDRGLALVARLPNLEYLSLDATDVGDEGLVHLAGMRSLKSVSLGATSVTPEGINRLKAARPGLEIDLLVDPEVERAVKEARKMNR